MPAYRRAGVELYSSAVSASYRRSRWPSDAVVKQDSALIDRFLGEFFHPFVRLGNQVPGYAVSLIKAGCGFAVWIPGGAAATGGPDAATRRGAGTHHRRGVGAGRGGGDAMTDMTRITAIWPRRGAGRSCSVLRSLCSAVAQRAGHRPDSRRAGRAWQFGAALRLAARYAHRKPSSPRNMRPRKPARMTSGAAHTGVSAVMSAPTASAVRVPVYSSLARVFEGRWFEPMAHRCLLIGADEDETTEGSVIGSQSPRPQWRPL